MQSGATGEMTKEMGVLAARDVDVYYGDFHAVRKVSIDVPKQKVTAFIGPSGGGKSSLLNAIDPELELPTGELSRKTGTGRHTTVGSRLIPLRCGGLVADTPGFGDVGLWSVPPEEVADCFPEMAEPAESCRFRGCTHRSEPDCGVLAAVEAGEIPASRYESYRTLYEEADASTGY